MFESGFEKFWNAWPSSPRKGARISCKMKWVSKEFELQTDEIITPIKVEGLLDLLKSFNATTSCYYY